MIPEMPSPRLVCTVHDSVSDVASNDWQAIVDEDADLAMDRRLIAVQQGALRDECRIWTVMLHQADGRPAACACLCLFRVDGTLSANAVTSGAVEFARRAWPGLLRFNVLFCGLPAPPGACHLRVARGIDHDRVMAALHQVMHALAHRHDAALIVFKEMSDAQHDCGRWLTRHRYIAGDVPAMHALRGDFRAFDEYLATMRSRYRAQVQRSRRKIISGGLTIEHARDASEIERLYTPHAHALYEAVWRRSEYKLERVPREFILDAARAMSDSARLTVISRGTSPVGFTFSMTSGATWHNMYSGVDYAINGDGDILFNLFYADLAAAFASGYSDIRLGQTSDTFKARLGASAQTLRFYVRARSTLLHAGMRAFSAALFPAVPQTRTQHVFKNGVADEHVLTHDRHAHRVAVETI